ncbi:ATP-binding protein [Acidobacteriota bacterium]
MKTAAHSYRPRRLLAGVIACLSLWVSLGAQEAPDIPWPDTFRARQGDDPAWSRPDFDDSGWQVNDWGSALPVEWIGVRWLRFELDVDPALWGEPFAFSTSLFGAVEVFINGKPAVRHGLITPEGRTADMLVISRKVPALVMFEAPPASFPDQRKQVIAIRTSNALRKNPLFAGFTWDLAFDLSGFETTYRAYTQSIHLITFHQVLLTGLGMTFALLHFLLFIFYPEPRSNLYFALLAAAGSLIFFAEFQQFLTQGPWIWLILHRLNLLGIVLASLASIRFVYSLLPTERKRLSRGFLAAAVILGALVLFRPTVFEGLVRVFMLIVGLEITRVSVASRLRKERVILEGSWIIGLGAIPLVLFTTYEGLTHLAGLPRLFPHHVFPIDQYAFLILLLSMSVFLARSFAWSKKDLKRRSEDLERLNIELEDRVEQRTKELAEANTSLESRNVELEASRNEIQTAHSELQAAQTRLVQSEKMASLGSLVAGVAHEINNPVGAIQGSADVIRRSLEKLTRELETSVDPEVRARMQRYLDILDDNSHVTLTASRRVTEIIRSLKTFARLDEAELQQIDVHENLESALTLLQHEMKSRIEVKREYGELPRIYAYPSQLNQVFMNILANAIAAVQGEGIITISTSAKPEEVMIRIADSGPGIPKAHLPKIFDPGFTTKGAGVGMGLGLSISYNIVKDHKGEITAQSAPGGGAVFSIRLPIGQERGNT